MAHGQEASAGLADLGDRSTVSLLARLDMSDRQLLSDLLWEGSLSGDPVEVSHYFSYPHNHEGCRATADELRANGYEIWLGEEVGGDDFWHICARRRESLRATAVAETRCKMESLADRDQGFYDGWDLSSSALSCEGWALRRALEGLRRREDWFAERRAAAGLPVSR